MRNKSLRNLISKYHGFLCRRYSEKIDKCQCNDRMAIISASAMIEIISDFEYNIKNYFIYKYSLLFLFQKHAKSK